MRTSDTPRSKPHGFTLLELVVVLALLGLATALVAPAGFRMIGSWRRATEVDAALGVLASLGERARQEGRALHFDKGLLAADRLAGLPDGWQVELAEPLSVQANGACQRSHGLLRHGEYSRAFALDAPYCRTRLDAGGEP